MKRIHRPGRGVKMVCCAVLVLESTTLIERRIGRCRSLERVRRLAKR